MSATETGERLASIVSAWTEMFSSGDTAALADLLDERVVWQGIGPDEICHNRGEVLELLTRRRRKPPRLTRFEAEEIGDRVAVSVDGPDFAQADMRAGPRSLVFTFADGRIVRMESLATRDDAFRRARA
jgi:ketosteroid isomerase-like protein